MCSNPWTLYDQLIEGVPSGIAVTDFCIGASWSYVEAECGIGLAKTVQGGGRETFRQDPCSVDLRTLCQLAKSWNWTEATLGVAALNAFYTTPEKIESFGGSIDAPAPTPAEISTTPGESSVAESDEKHSAEEARGVKLCKTPGDTATWNASNPFKYLREAYAGKRVAVVGHFPNVNSMAGICQLTVLERNCQNTLDIPDSACEYVLSSQDFVFMTGTTLHNKTMPRLLELAANATTVVAGPSAIPSPVMFEHGADHLCGSVVTDPAFAKLAVRGGTKQQWRAGIRKFCLVRA